MKIIHLERNFALPTETFIANQINALSDGYENFVFTAKYDNNFKVNAEIKVPPFKKYGTKILPKSHIQYFSEQLGKIQPDVFHAHFITDACLFHPLTKNFNIPKVCSCYGWDVTEVPKKFKYLYKYFYNKVINEYDVFLAMSEDMKVDLMKIGVPENKIQIHYHGINTKNFTFERNYFIKEGKINLLTIASLRNKKGHMTVLKALKVIQNKRKDINFTYHIVGKGPLEKKLKQFIVENNLEEKVVFHGLIKHGPELNRIIDIADVFLHPSQTTRTNDKEGIPGALIEAMTAGLPVISTYHAGIPEVITTGENGILIQERNFNQLQEAIVSLFDDEYKRKILGTNARAYAYENLDYIMKGEKLKNIYKNIFK